MRIGKPRFVAMEFGFNRRYYLVKSLLESGIPGIVGPWASRRRW